MRSSAAAFLRPATFGSRPYKQEVAGSTPGPPISGRQAAGAKASTSRRTAGPKA